VGYNGAFTCQCDPECQEFDNCCVDFLATCPAAERIVMKENVRRGPLRAAMNPLKDAGIFLPVAIMCAAVVALAPIIAVVRMSCRSDDRLPIHTNGDTHLMEQYKRVPEQPPCGSNRETLSREVIEENRELLPKRSGHLTRGDTEEVVSVSAEQGFNGNPFQPPSREPTVLSDVEGGCME